MAMPHPIEEDRYTDWQPVGKGSSATVYRVFDEGLDSVVAIKLLHEQHRAHADLIDGMRREVLISRGLRHPNICAIHDLYEGAQGSGVVMEYVEGEDLRVWMDRHQGNLLATAPQRLSTLRNIAETLTLAHTRIIHRDLKPANVFLRNGDIERPVIMDFGISVIGNAGDRGPRAGTPKYMAPEQYTAPSTVDQRSDLFSLGIMAYELMTGGRVPPCSLHNVLHDNRVPRVDLAEIPPPSAFCMAVPPALDSLILQLLAYEPGERPQSAAEVVRALQLVNLRSELAVGAGQEKFERNAVTVPAATYFVGSASDGPNEAEKPMRRVSVSQYQIDMTPVTNRAYRDFVAATGHTAPPAIDHAKWGVDDHPIVMVTWDDATAYAEWVGGRLPTEIEWEIAAKAGERFAHYPWGDDKPGPIHANIDFLHDKTSSVFGYPTGRNAWGLWDMCGNVWEWCLDGWQEDLYHHIGNDAIDPHGDLNATMRSLRGGSFESFAATGRCAFRNFAARNERRADIGFRVAYPSKTVSSVGNLL